MTSSLRLALVVHNHQPIGNFDSVVERAYDDAYLPLLETFARFPRLRIALHLSGSLFDWLAERRPAYLERLAALRDEGRVEIVGGAYYEPILPMIPRRDRLAQIRLYREKLSERFGVAPTGMWLPERVWEQQLAGDLAAAGVEYTILDDFHFRNAGLTDEQLRGYYLTEDDGRLLAVFPGNERLRYLIPFASPEQVIDYLREVAEARPGATLVFADDGEKFGLWPGTRELCRDRGWLERFFQLLSDAPWIETTTPGDVTADVEPLGKVYLPDGSYPEMIGWARLEAAHASGGHEPVDADQANDPHAPACRRPLTGTWRNFLVKYPEAGEMRARMLMVSDRVARAAESGYPAEIVAAARRELYQAQCNCAYWHGTFGGVYLTHLRQAVYRHLIRADEILDRTADRPPHWAEPVVGDHNLDVRPEVCLASDRLMAFVAPHEGGRLYELDVRAAARNVIDTLGPRPEPYHGEAGSYGHAAARVPASYEARSRRCLIERFFDEPPTAEQLAAGRAVDHGDFAYGPYQFRCERHAGAARVVMCRKGRVADRIVRLTKTITLAAGSDALSIDYALENLPTDRTLHFGVEFNFAASADDDATPEHVEARATDWLAAAPGLKIGLAAGRPTAFAEYPLRVVNRWEYGYEVTHQAKCVVAHWPVEADARGNWNVTISLVATPLDAGGRRIAADHADLGDAEQTLHYPAARIVAETETVPGKREVRRRTTRRLKAAG